MNLITPGLYKGRAEHAELGYTQTGKEQVIVRFRLVDPPYESRLMTYYGVITENTESRVLKGLLYCGWDGASDDFAGVTKNIVTLDIQIEPDQHNGMRNRICWIFDRKAALAKRPLDDEQRAAFFGRVRGTAEQLKADIDARMAENPDASAAPDTSGEFPFP